MSQYPSLTPTEAADLLAGVKKTVITTHVRPDGDTVGTAMALSVMLREMGGEAFVSCADPLPERLKFIVGEGSFISPEEANSLCRDKGFCTLAVDVASLSQWGGLKDILPTPKLVIDHHALSQPFAPHLTVPEAASAAEALWLVAKVFIYRGELTMTRELATHLYTAISSDTGCFKFSNVTPSTLRIAAELLEVGVDHAGINRLLFDSKPLEQMWAEAFIASSIKTEDGGSIAYATLTLGDLDSLGLRHEHFETAIDIVRSLCGVRIAMVLKEQTPGVFKASLRSVDTDVSAVAALFGGGGHVLAAGCTVSAPTPDQAEELLLKAIEEKIPDPEH